MQDRELTYVQASRARESMRLYTDKHEAGDKLSRLAKQMNKSHEKTLAHEIIVQQEKEREELRLRQHLRI
jgi:ATP-dependent exoDNAse (exonuclease V) alpha subunit